MSARGRRSFQDFADSGVRAMKDVNLSDDQRHDEQYTGSSVAVTSTA